MGGARRIAILSLLFPAGCFLYGADEPIAAEPPIDLPDASRDDTTVDASTDGGDSGTSIVVPTSCAPKAPFTKVAPVAEVNTPDDESFAHLSTDELTLYLSRGNAVAVYTRPAKTDAFKGGAGLDVNGGNSSRVRVTDDTLRAYFDAYLGGGVNTTRMVSKSRPTTTAVWTEQGNRVFQLGAPDGVPELDVFPLPDEKTIYFASERSGALTLWVTRKENDQWQIPPIELQGLNTTAPAGDRNPVVAADESFLYFQSARVPGKPGQSLIWVAFQQGPSNTFGGVALAEGIDAPAGSNSFPVWLSPDSCRLYFISNRTGGKGQNDLWLASRTP